MYCVGLVLLYVEWCMVVECVCGMVCVFDCGLYYYF